MLQIWYIVPPAKCADFLRYLRERVTSGVGLSYIKQLLPHIPADVMDALGIVKIVQKPLQAVITLPVSVALLHFTLVKVEALPSEVCACQCDLP